MNKKNIVFALELIGALAFAASNVISKNYLA